jgi:hypothetical protein
MATSTAYSTITAPAQTVTQTFTSYTTSTTTEASLTLTALTSTETFTAEPTLLAAGLQGCSISRLVCNLIVFNMGSANVTIDHSESCLSLNYGNNEQNLAGASSCSSSPAVLPSDSWGTVNATMAMWPGSTSVGEVVYGGPAETGGPGPNTIGLAYIVVGSNKAGNYDYAAFVGVFTP